MTYFTKSQVRQAVDNGVNQGFSAEDIVNEMVGQGHQLEGFNAPETRIPGAYPYEQVLQNQEGIGKQTGKQLYNAGNELVTAAKNPGGIIGGIVKTGLGILESGVEDASGFVSDVGGAFGLDIPRISIPTFHPDGRVTYDEDTPEQETAKDVAGSIGRDLGLKNLARGDVGGAFKEMGKTMFEAPISTALNFVGGKVAGKTARTGELPKFTRAAKAIKERPGMLATGFKGAGEELASKATGLSTDTMKTVVRHPSLYKKATTGEITRGSIAHRVKSSIDSRLKDIGEAGREYDTIRRSNQIVEISDDAVSNVLKKYGLEATYPEGTLKLTSESRPLSAGDIRGIEDFLRVYGSYRKLSSNGFLNAREALSKLSEFDVARSDIGNQIARDLRSAYNNAGRPQLKGLAELDKKYAPERAFLSEVKREYLKTVIDESGARATVLKDNALSKIMNSTNKGREQILSRLEKLDPGIADEIRVLKALEDVELAGQNKVGTYFRAGIGVTGVATGNLPMLVGAILTSPQVVARILEWYGSKRGFGDAEGVMLKMKRGAKLLPEEKVFVQDAITSYEKVVGESRMPELKGGKQGRPGIEQPAPIPEEMSTGIKSQKYNGSVDSLVENADAGMQADVRKFFQRQIEHRKELQANGLDFDKTDFMQIKNQSEMWNVPIPDELKQSLPPAQAQKGVEGGKVEGMNPALEPLAKEARKYKSVIDIPVDMEMPTKLDNLYHATTPDRLDSIVKTGITSGNKSSKAGEGVSGVKNISLSGSEKQAAYYVPENRVLLRTKSEFDPTLEHDILGGAGNFITKDNIPPNMLEIKTKDGWQSLTEFHSK